MRAGRRGDGALVIQPLGVFHRQELLQEPGLGVGAGGRAARIACPAARTEDVLRHLALGVGGGPQLLDLDLGIQFLGQRVVGLEDLALGESLGLGPADRQIFLW